jgi:hypothetical protein
LLLAFGRHHDNRRLLARLSRRRHQAPLPVRPADSQVFPSPVFTQRFSENLRCGHRPLF